MKMQVADKVIHLKIWQGGDKRRVYLNAYPADGSKAVGKSYDWGYVDDAGLQNSKKGGFTNYRYARQTDPTGFEAMVEAAKKMLEV